MRNSQLRGSSAPTAPLEPATQTIAQPKSATTMVRRAVARWELTPSMPSLAKTAVTPAKNVEAKAYRIHIRASGQPWPL